MTTNINMPPPDVWEYFQCVKDDLKSHMHQIADNYEYGVEIFLSEDSGFPNIVVVVDDEQVYDETVINAHDCQITVEEIYDKYLTSKAIDYLSNDGEMDEESAFFNVDDIIYERECDLDGAVFNFVKTVVQSDYINYIPDIDDVIDDLKEHFLEYMFRKHGLRIYRPMILEYEDGEEALVKYPYEDMEFEDPDNPLYET